MKNYKIQIAYQGTRYHGWQVQPNELSIQELIQNALKQILQEEIKVRGSGRTDAGVHALAQVANFKTENALDPRRILTGINALLPEDIFVSHIDEVSLDFDAMLDAKSKTYIYLMHWSQTRNPFLKNFVWNIHGDLDLASVRNALKMIEGEHDFGAFTASDSQARHYVRRLSKTKLLEVSLSEIAPLFDLSSPVSALSSRAQRGDLNDLDCSEKNPYLDRCYSEHVRGIYPIEKNDGHREHSVAIHTTLDPGSSPEFLIFTFTGNGFLKHMIRNLVGTLKEVALRKLSIEDFETILNSKDRTQAGVTAPAQGLFLKKVFY